MGSQPRFGVGESVPLLHSQDVEILSCPSFVTAQGELVFGDSVTFCSKKSNRSHNRMDNNTGYKSWNEE